MNHIQCITITMPSGNIAHLSHEIIFSLYEQQLSKHCKHAQISLNTHQHCCKEKQQKFFQCNEKINFMFTQPYTLGP